MRYRITVEYFGKNYSGWQRQKNALSVQEVLENKLSEFFNQKIIVIGSGRTDCGVHAYGQVAHFDAETKIPADKLVYPLNTVLPSDIKIKECRIADPDFHAQYSAKRKTYIYKIFVSRMPSPLRDSLYAWIIPPIDLEKMKEAAPLLLGRHDFKAFSSTGCEKKSTVREIYRLDINQSGQEIIMEVEGNGFLYNMVRIIAGTLVYIGKGKLDKDVICRMLETGNRKLGGKTFPACGLYLKEVVYPGD